MSTKDAQISVVLHTDADRRELRRIAEVSSDSSLAHAPEWLAVIQNAYGHNPLYLSAADANGGAGLLPAFVVRRPFFGTAVTSMPFLDTGGPCSTSAALASTLVEHLVDEARRAGAAVVDLRCTTRLTLEAQPMEHKVNMVLPLPPDANVLWRQLDSSVRSQIRKAERSGLCVEFGGEERLDDFYGVFAHRMRELGSPVHARAFFAAIFQAFEQNVRLAFVTRDGRAIGGLLALAFKDTIVVPWASCLSQHFRLCPNMLLYWHTIRTACDEGFRRFDFGRSTRDSGTYRFKRQWGAQEAPLFWYSIPLNGPSSETPGNGGRGFACAMGIWQRLPLAVTTNLGPRIRKYLIQ
jgi:FemAB-related protein (PEP-CTERM system-associated)